MGATKVNIASQALGLLRANPISSFTEGTNEADIVDLYYNTFVLDIFSRHPWSFALRKVQATRDTTTPVNEFKYRYHKPSGMLKIYKVYNTNSVGVAPIPSGWDLIGDYIYTSQEEIYVEGAYYIDEGSWPGFFITYAVHALAAYIALPISDDEGLAATMQALAYGSPAQGERGGKFQVAAGVDARQQPPEEIHSFDIISARFG